MVKREGVWCPFCWEVCGSGVEGWIEFGLLVVVVSVCVVAILRFL